MALIDGCIFCRIIRGEIPAFKLIDDEQVVAFMDINPANPGHALVIPKFHARDLYEMPDEWLAPVIAAARRVARAVTATLDPDGLNLLQANGPGAAQSVEHFHLHVLPRNLGDDLSLNWAIVPGDMDAIASLAEKIRGHLSP
ncbi:HIT family protein [Oceanibacterium hippocampi]|uniref:HIT-like protein n=1 Tax=Oceanibacterium hippocampi TaxID=745714 RepID=A0A1Y5S1N6_9PROT|nr:HIT domain-containing protein [Oceanibacterium hippocampi]SLN30275.1 HIT-like protein [Oceanibacterium hippocampi]